MVNPFKVELKFFLYAYIFFASWTGVFILGDIVKFPEAISFLSGVFAPHVVIGSLTFLLYFIKYSGHFLNNQLYLPRGVKKVYQIEDIFLFFGYSGVLLSAAVNPGPKTLNYLAGYLYVFFIAYLVFKGLFYLELETEQLLTANLLGVLFVALFSIMELLLEHVYGINIRTLLLGARKPNAPALYAGGMSRSYGLATEPGVLAFYFETLGVIAIWKLLREKFSLILKISLISIILLGWTFTFSAASVVALTFALCFTGFVLLLTKLKIRRIRFSPIIVVLFIGILVLSFYSIYTGKINLVRPILIKIGNVGTSERMRYWLEGLEQFARTPIFGAGMGNISVKRSGLSYVNWYLFLTTEGGLLSAIPYLSFLFFSGLRILNSKVKGKFWFFTAFLAGTTHLAVISTFFHPFLWILLIIFNHYLANYFSLSYERLERRF